MAKMQDMKIMLFPGRYIQGNGAIEFLPEVMEKYGDKPFVIATKSMMARAEQLMNGKGKVEKFGGECTRAEIDRLKDLISSFGATAVAAVGGGKPIDAAKIAADELNLTIIIASTIAATDAPTSGVAVTYKEDGVYEGVEYQKHNPDVVLIDTAICSAAPARFIVSGMGDALATYFEAASSDETNSLNEASGLRTKTAMALCKLCLDMLLQYGRQASIDAKSAKLTESVEMIIEANTLLSGLGFESGGLGSAHSVANGLTVLEGTHSRYHGEKVAYGTLVGLMLYDKLGIKDEIFDFCADVGLPVTLEDLCIGNATDAELMEVARSAFEENFMSHEPVELSTEKVFAAIKATDEKGRAIKAAKAK